MVTAIKRLAIVAVAAVATIALAWTLLGAPARSATPLDGFDPGMLISDDAFYASTRMDAAQVQTFLDREGRDCVPNSDGTPCLKDFTADVPNIAATQYCAAVTGGRQQRASAIIANLSRACGINPQVILVMLQKEQSLIYASGQQLTRPRYDKALGSGCPDFLPCDPNSAGFVMQVYSAGERFQKYRQHPERYNYKVGSNQILYHPSGTCGSATVQVRNQATAALYIYTPYVPNSALISSGGTQTDACSVAGNLNFYRYLKRWFPESASTSTAAPIHPSPGSFTTALTTNYRGEAHDLTGDRVIDLVAERGGRAQHVSPARRTAAAALTFDAPVQVGRGWSASGTFAAGDANRDGVPDLYLRDATGRLLFYPGQGTGFGAARQVGVGWGVMTWIDGGVDVTGDGRPDVLGRRTDGSMWLYAGDGSGGVRSGVRVGWGWGGFSKLTLVPQAQGGPAAVVGVDANGRLRTYPISNGRFASPRTNGSGWTSLTVAGLADVNGDGRGELFAITPTGAAMLYTGTATSYESRGQVGHGWGGQKVISSRMAGTTNHLWSVDAGGRLWRRGFTWTADQYHLPPANTGVSVPAGALLVTPGDWTGDGRPDLIWRRADGALIMHRGQSGGSFAATGEQIGNGWGGFDQIIAAGDWQGSGRPALLAFTRSTGTVMLYPGNGAGGFGTRQVLSTRMGWADLIVNAGRWDGDGYPDLIGRRATDGALLLVPGSAGTPMGYQTRRVGVGWSGMSTIVGGADQDGDGRPDLVTVDANNQLRIYRGDGRGGFLGSTLMGEAPTGRWY